MTKQISTHHPITTSENFSSTVKIATMILQIKDAQRHKLGALALNSNNDL
jgi:hypothetical protein